MSSAADACCLLALHGSRLSPAPSEEQHLHGWHELVCAENSRATTSVLPFLPCWAGGSHSAPSRTSACSGGCLEGISATSLAF